VCRSIRFLTLMLYLLSSYKAVRVGCRPEKIKLGTSAVVMATALRGITGTASQASTAQIERGALDMNTVKTKDGADSFFKDWGPKDARPIVFHHGWPLSADDWDAQMLFFLAQGYRVVAHDRRGHGRSSQVGDGHDMDHYAADASAVAEHLNLKTAVHIGHSTGGGEVARYVAKCGQPQGRVAKAVLVSGPLMVKTKSNPGGTPIEGFDGFRAALAANRSQFFLDLPTGPFYGFNRSGAKASQSIIQNWWRQGMMGSAKAHYEGIKAFSETDRRISKPSLSRHLPFRATTTRSCPTRMPQYCRQSS